MQDRMREFLNEAFKHRWDQRGRNGHWTRHSNFARCWVSQAIDVAGALLQLVEDRDAAVQQRLTVYGWLNPFWTAFKKANSQQPFQIGDCFGHGRLRDRKLIRGLSEAAKPGGGSE